MDMKKIRKDLIDSLERRFAPRFSREDIEEIVVKYHEVISEALQAGHDIELRGFATFKVIEKASVGRNFKTGSRVRTEPRKKVKINPSRSLLG